MKKSVQIKWTSDYSKFERSTENRQTDLKKHKRLERSLKKYGFLDGWPIVSKPNGSGKLKVLDGQHRLTLAEQLGLPVAYIETTSDFEIAEINNTQQTWSLNDYAETYAAQGKKEYQTLLEFREKNGINISLAATLLGGTTTFNNVSRQFRDGTFKVRDSAYADRVAKVYCPIAALTKSVRNSRFIEACMAACRTEGFDPDRMVAAAKKCREKLLPFATRDAYLGMMEDIYNFHRQRLFALRINAIEVMRSRNAAKTAKASDNGKHHKKATVSA